MSKNNSMINPSIVDLLNKVDNRYSLVVATSRRARQLIEVEDSNTIDKAEKPLTVAINEVSEGIINVIEQEDIIEEDEAFEKFAKVIMEENNNGVKED